MLGDEAERTMRRSVQRWNTTSDKSAERQVVNRIRRPAVRTAPTRTLTAAGSRPDRDHTCSRDVGGPNARTATKLDK